MRLDTRCDSIRHAHAHVNDDDDGDDDDDAVNPHHVGTSIPKGTSVRTDARTQRTHIGHCRALQTATLKTRPEHFCTTSRTKSPLWRAALPPLHQAASTPSPSPVATTAAEAAAAIAATAA